MPDNINVTPGSGATIAADLISSVLHQRVKVEYGADGSATDVDATHPLPVGSGDSDDDAPAGGLMPIAGIYQSTVDEVDAGDVGRLRMSKRRSALVAVDHRLIAGLTVGNENPTGSDIGTLAASDFDIRDTNPHYFTIPIATAGWRFCLINIYFTASFDQTASIIVYMANSGLSGSTAKILDINAPSGAYPFSIASGITSVGQGGTAGGANATNAALYCLPMTGAPFGRLLLRISFATAPTTGRLRLEIERTT